MAEKKEASCCGRIVAHKANGDPYTHACATPGVPAAVRDEFLAARRAAVDPSLRRPVVEDHKHDFVGDQDTCVNDPHCQLTWGEFLAARRAAVDPSPLTAEAFATPPEEECEHPNGFGVNGCPCGASAPDELCVSAEISHVFTWNAASGESQCMGCGTPDSGALTAEPTHVYDDGNGGQWIHPGTEPHCPEQVCLPPSARRITPDSGALKAERAAAAAELNVPVSSVRAVVQDEVILSTEPSPYIALLAAEVGDPGTVADAFSAPAAVAEKLNVSGQPDARYEWWGKQNRGYLVKLPETGDFRRYANGKPKGLARVTTFNKAASDQNAISDWNKRNVLIGASLRPDLVAKAHGLGHENDTAALMSLVAQLETAAGAKVSADIGTLIHELTEKWDAGVIDFKGVPAAYRPLIKLYNDTLKEYGLRPVRGLIERTTYIPEYGGVVGTLDRVYYHERSGQYIIGDVKTGKTLKYGMDEIETQEWIYAHGVNESGVYDWNTDTWCPPGSYGDSVQTGPWSVPSVSEEWGVVIHMPVQGDDAGKCLLIEADLQRGRRHADVCHDVRTQRSNKPKPKPWTGERLGSNEKPTEPVVESLVGWESMFTNVQSSAQAHDLWESARAGGVEPMRLNALVQLAQQRLREIGAS